ncbi:GPW/gp25 family protein [Sorangium sp. So ce375]|uniref:GPW/gp25 family protein n=1 Tax=Sorangium sp. So ce375 TaxID=3133306 RepID=UPI003F5B126D
MAARSDDFLGNGWGFDFTTGGVGLDEARRVAEAGGEAKIRQAIWILLSTARGERIGRPDFGCGIHELVFATRSSGTMGDIARAVTEAIQRWEPRVELVSVDARLHPSDPQGVLVDIHYEVRATNSRSNLVYPFYLSI